MRKVAFRALKGHLLQTKEPLHKVFQGINRWHSSPCRKYRKTAQITPQPVPCAPSAFTTRQTAGVCKTQRPFCIPHLPGIHMGNTLPQHGNIITTNIWIYRKFAVTLHWTAHPAPGSTGTDGSTNSRETPAGKV